MQQLAIPFKDIDQFSYQNYISNPLEQKPCLISKQGVLFEEDCLVLLNQINDSVADVIFADPPFNLGKKYGKKHDDNLEASEYITWCYDWLNECFRILKEGGSLFIYNLPKWNIFLGAYLMNHSMQKAGNL